MNVILIDPPYERLMGIKTTPLYPLGIGYLSAYLNANGHEARYINLDFEDGLPYSNPFSRLNNIKNYKKYMSETIAQSPHPVWKQIKELVKKLKPDVIGISCITLKMPAVIRMVEIIKGCCDIPIVVGGHHAQIFAREILENIPQIDYVVRGEGEETLLELVNEISRNGGGRPGADKLKNIAGLCFRDGGAITENTERPLMQDLDSLPFPDSAEYPSGDTFVRMPMTVLMGSRGCPYSCNYCATNNIWHRKLRWRSVGNVLDEIRYRIKTQNDYYYGFFDDCFTLNKKWFTEFCDRVLSEKIGIDWGCMSSVSLMDEKIFNKLVDARCTKLNLAVESGSERVLELANKHIDLNHVRAIFKFAKKYNISTTAWFMMGFPGETVDDVRKTQEIMKELAPNWAYANVLIPLPGTEFYRQAVEDGMIDPANAWSGRIYKHLQVNYTGKIDDATFEKLVDETFQTGFRINSSFMNLWRRLPLRHYLHNPKKLILDFEKFRSWVKTR